MHHIAVSYIIQAFPRRNVWNSTFPFVLRALLNLIRMWCVTTNSKPIVLIWYVRVRCIDIESIHRCDVWAKFEWISILSNWVWCMNEVHLMAFWILRNSVNLTWLTISTEITIRVLLHFCTNWCRQTIKLHANSKCILNRKSSRSFEIHYTFNSDTIYFSQMKQGTHQFREHKQIPAPNNGITDGTDESGIPAVLQ